MVQERGSVSHVFIDLDETLYSSPGVVEFMLREIESKWEFYGVKKISLWIGFMFEDLGIPKQDVKRLRYAYQHDYGTTLAGLVVRSMFFELLSSEDAAG